MKTRIFALMAVLSPIGLYADATKPQVENEDRELKISAGADFRIRQEIMRNVPGLPGAQGAMMPRALRKDINHLRLRPRVWVQADYANWRLYFRAADEFREYIVKNGTPRKRRVYNFPDEIILDNLYLERNGLFDGFLDLKIGRQDLYKSGGSALGLERIFLDGTSYDGSRSTHADMVRITLHPVEKGNLDLVALYDNGRNMFRYGTRSSRRRPVNIMHPAGCSEFDEWGGGAIWQHELFEGRLPYCVYTVHKHNESYHTVGYRRIPDKQITTFGLRFKPKITDEISLDIEGAKQIGTIGSRQAGGWMGYAAVQYSSSKKDWFSPYARFSLYYLSGDRHSHADSDNDTAWDPMWARAPCDSELMQYGTLYGAGYWSNLIHPKLSGGVKFGDRHALSVSAGPMFAAVQDRDGKPGAGDCRTYKGFLSVLRYDFPIWVSANKKSLADRFEITGSLFGELFNPGDYYSTSKPSFFARWEIVFKF